MSNMSVGKYATILVTKYYPKLKVNCFLSVQVLLKTLATNTKGTRVVAKHTNWNTHFELILDWTLCDAYFKFICSKGINN